MRPESPCIPLGPTLPTSPFTPIFQNISKEKIKWTCSMNKNYLFLYTHKQYELSERFHFLNNQIKILPFCPMNPLLPVGPGKPIKANFYDFFLNWFVFIVEWNIQNGTEYWPLSPISPTSPVSPNFEWDKWKNNQFGALNAICLMLPEPTTPIIPRYFQLFGLEFSSRSAD